MGYLAILRCLEVRVSGTWHTQPTFHHLVALSDTLIVLSRADTFLRIESVASRFSPQIFPGVVALLRSGIDWHADTKCNAYGAIGFPGSAFTKPRPGYNSAPTRAARAALGREFSLRSSGH